MHIEIKRSHGSAILDLSSLTFRFLALILVIILLFELDVTKNSNSGSGKSFFPSSNQ
jgi:hypothetical protein